MKVTVIGSRNFDSYEVLQDTLNRYKITAILSGGAKGADSLAEKYAKENEITFTKYLPDWKKYGRGAGPVRNREMVKDAEMIVAFWDGKSKGTKHAIDFAQEKKKKVVLVNG